MHKKIKSLLALATVLLLIQSCGSDSETNPDKFLVSATSFLSRSASEMKTFIGASGLNVPLDEIQYDTEIFHVTYRTHYKGEEILASGLVILPQTDDVVSMLSFQHGTISAHDQAPTALLINSSELVYYTALSTVGMITAVPDFIGFGESSDVMHPYYVEEYTAHAVIDLIQAAKELAAKQDLNFNGKLFLAGYSQGGYATMAAHKFIEEQGLPGFKLAASFPASGGYDIKGVQEYFFDQEEYDQPYYLAYVARSYQTAYDWTQPLSQFFKEPYASRIPDLFDGSNSGSEINAQLTNTVADLVTADILAEIDTDPQYSYIVNAFNENSLTGWVPERPMYMSHGDADDTVPYDNSVDVYSDFLANGADSVYFTTFEGATHATGVQPFIEYFIHTMLNGTHFPAKEKALH